MTLIALPTDKQKTKVIEKSLVKEISKKAAVSHYRLTDGHSYKKKLLV